MGYILMSAAAITGARRARAYLCRCSPEQLAATTFAQFCAIGRLDAREKYKQKKTREDFALSWFQVGQQFLTLFKPEENEQFVADKEMERTMALILQATQKIEKLLDWRPEDSVMNSHFIYALERLGDARWDIEEVLDYLKAKGQS